MSAPPGRSATVTSLSGRVNALKFMQRASPSSSSSFSSSSPSTPSKPRVSRRSQLASPSPSAGASPAPSISESSALGGEAEEEQWSLSPAAIAKLRAKAQGKNIQQKNADALPIISQEAGFDAWLITREKDSVVAEEEKKPNARQTFGKLGKNKQDDNDEEEGQSRKRSRSNNHNNKDEDDGGLEPDFGSASQDEKSKPSKGFVKPGSLKSENPSASKKAKKNTGGKKDQDKVVFARKRGGKLGISGGGR
ncbi:uncharacterized protein UTRI_05342 [Ustilago trichophora]|uniref:Uncharacterized protein n=1 Tax=Ustilago trichophora TaxID=86804 RepID=A0A5C3EKV7_9BASI|nr:uncharacterized protein UTRI_05342 [Ustilago trichophora]